LFLAARIDRTRNGSDGFLKSLLSSTEQVHQSLFCSREPDSGGLVMSSDGCLNPINYVVIDSCAKKEMNNCMFVTGPYQIQGIYPFIKKKQNFQLKN
jgi:hypothetical protein